MTKRPDSIESRAGSLKPELLDQGDGRFPLPSSRNASPSDSRALRPTILGLVKDMQSQRSEPKYKSESGDAEQPPEPDAPVTNFSQVGSQEAPPRNEDVIKTRDAWHPHGEQGFAFENKDLPETEPEAA